ncbi:SIMPL domain-containing protein [Vampirovibrio sp.]|uniref:SIMPL domain-containing protein n=1 Tax=Vampirovibrio sp. TaxID=2717857 RepID=UPI00359421C3
MMMNRTNRILSIATLALAFTLAVGMSVGVFADDGPKPGIISTQGHGEVKVRPDSLSVDIRVETKSDKLPMARAENNRKTQAIIAALKGLAIPGMKMETQGLTVYPLQHYEKDKLPKVIGYNVSNGLTVTVTGASPDALGDYGSRIVDTALNSGANHVGSLGFFLDDATPARNQALELAVKDARRNADVMAKASDITLTGVHSLEGSPQFGGFPRPMPMYAMKSRGAEAEADVSAPVETGETTITSDVTARFKF